MARKRVRFRDEQKRRRRWLMVAAGAVTVGTVMLLLSLHFLE